MHNIEYSELPGEMTINEINEWVCKEVASLGDHYGTEKVTVPCTMTFSDCGEAEKYLQAHSDGFYSGVAVKYKAYSYTTTTKSKELAKKRDKLYAEMYDYQVTTSVRNKTSQFLGCPECGSKLNRERLNNRNECPVCGTDLRCKTVRDKLANYRERIKKADKQSQDAMKKNYLGDKWLVKWEYHS